MRRLIVIHGGLSATALANTPIDSEIRAMKEMNDYLPISDGDREEIVQMIEFGWSNDQILQMLPHIDKRSITAYRAHVTRGTYEPGATHGREKHRTNR